MSLTWGAPTNPPTLAGGKKMTQQSQVPELLERIADLNAARKLGLSDELIRQCQYRAEYMALGVGNRATEVAMRLLRADESVSVRLES